MLCYTYLICNCQTDAERVWIEQNSIEIPNDDSDFKSFNFLDTLIENKRIVMLGENTHGSAEYFNLKNRIISSLHEKHGFNVIAWESNILDCFAVESQKSRLTAKEMAMGCLHYVNRTEQVLPIMQYVKNTNMTLIGFDPQPTVYSDATGQFMEQLECIDDSLRFRLHYIDSLSQTILYNQKRNRKIVADEYEEVLHKVMQEDCENDTKEVLIKGKDSSRSR
jgi:erythromycin esterase